MEENYQKAKNAILLGILGNIALATIKIVSGILGNTFVLVADGIESFSDVFSSILVWFGIQYANRPADKNHPYGHGKAEPLFTFLVVLFLVIAAIYISYQAVINIQTPHELPKPFTLYILAGIIILKEVLYRINTRIGKRTQSTIVNADAWHHRSDAITSLAAFIGIVIALYMGKGWETADDWAAIIASIIILINAYNILRPALAEIMDEHVYDEMIRDITLVARTVDGVVNTEKCYVRKHGMRFNVDLHLIVSGKISVLEGHNIAHATKEKLMKRFPEIMDVLIHIEPDICEIDYER